MLKKVKQKLLSRNVIGRYLSYALGEVILIVIGILVAISIDNWNEERKEKNVVKGIFAVLVNDIKQDTAEVNRILDVYDKKKAIFLKVGYDTLTEEEIGQCALCPHLISSWERFIINKRGISQLNEYSNHTLGSQDSLIFDIVNFYSSSIDKVENFNDIIHDDILGNLTYWRDKYPWFAASMQGKLKKEDLSYFGRSQEYRNKVAFHYITIYENYVPILQEFKNTAEAILKRLDERLN